MSSHRAAHTDQRDSGHRRIAIATTASAVGGTALAVLFGTVFAHAAAAPSAAATTLVDAAARAELAPAAVKVDAHDTSVDDVNAAPRPTTTPSRSAPVRTRHATPTTTLQPPPAAPTKAPATTTAAAPAHASTGAS